jgi:hypothetical protein
MFGVCVLVEILKNPSIKRITTVRFTASDNVPGTVNKRPLEINLSWRKEVVSTSIPETRKRRMKNKGRPQHDMHDKVFKKNSI